MKKLGIYVHIPFCIKKCNYCDFNSYDHKEEWKNAYVDALIQEIGAFCADGYLVDSIFFGGGTPTTLSNSQLERILRTIFQKFSMEESAEITIESNPKTVKDYRSLKEMGFNRLSIGMQSANEEELKKLGRIHTFQDFVESYEKARKVFANINIDTMFSLPDQTIDKWAYTLEQVNILQPAHISAYSLKIEEGTPFSKLKLALPDEETDRQMYNLASEMLTGYNRYEISNFAKEGMECKHNLKYWLRMDYVGFGAGAHSNLDDLRYSNIEDLDTYIKAQNKVAGKCKLTQRDQMSEFMFLGLRLTAGIDERDFEKAFHKEITEVFALPIQKHLGLETLAYHNGRYSLTEYGVDVSNVVLSDFLLE